MADKTRKPSIAQSLEIIFEISTENTEIIKNQSAMLKQTLDLASNLGSTSNNKIVQESEKRILRELEESRQRLIVAIFEKLPNFEKMDDDIGGLSKLLMTYFTCSIIGITLAGIASYKIYLQNNDLEQERTMTQQVQYHYHKFVKDEKLEDRYQNWMEVKSKK